MKAALLAGNRSVAVKGVECRVCSSDKMHPLGTCREIGEVSILLFPHRILPEHARGELYQCLNCGLGQRIPCLNEGELKVLYESMEENQMSYEFESSGAWVKARELLTHYWNESDSPGILDIGAYEGRFLNGLPTSWRTYAIEPSKKAIPVLRKAAHTVIGEFLTDARSEWHGQFDAVCMFDVIEHLHNPLDGLVNALRYLRPGGRLFISTGNMDAWTWKWLVTDHWYLESPLHLSIGSVNFFQWLCKRAGGRLSGIHRVPHRREQIGQRMADFLTAIYFGCRRRRGLWRLLPRLILSLPGKRHLMHKNGMPCTFSLRDHILVEIEKPAGRRDS